MDTEHKIYLLFGKKMTGRITADELRQLADLIAKNPHLQYSTELLHDVWYQRKERSAHLSEEDFLRLWNRINQQQMKHDHRVSFIVRIAALKKHILHWITGNRKAAGPQARRHEYRIR